MPTKFSNDGITGGDTHVVDPGASATGDLARVRNEAVAELARTDEGDVALRGDRA